MKKIIAALSVTTILVGGILFTSPTIDQSMEVEPSVLSTNTQDS